MDVDASASSAARALTSALSVVNDVVNTLSALTFAPPHAHAMASPIANCASSFLTSHIDNTLGKSTDVVLSLASLSMMCPAARAASLDTFGSVFFMTSHNALNVSPTTAEGKSLRSDACPMASAATAANVASVLAPLPTLLAISMRILNARTASASGMTPDATMYPLAHNAPS